MSLVMLKNFLSIASCLRGFVVFFLYSMAVDFCQMLLASIDMILWFYFSEY